MSLADQVKLNLVHYNLWTDVKILKGSSASIVVISGIPPKPLPAATQLAPNYKHSTTEPIEIEPAYQEWVFPIHKNEKLTMQRVDKIFQEMTLLNNNSRPSRFLISIVDVDGTVTYYFIHDGIAKPRQS